MSKIWFAISLVGLLACGTGESDSGATGSLSDTPPVSATAGGDVKAAAAPESKQAEAEAAEISSCTRLVASGDYQEAVPVCLKAASIDANNADVKAALVKAQAEAAKEAASGAAADAAAKALGGIGN